MGSGVVVVSLADRPDLIEALARIRWQEWDHRDLETWIGITRAEAGTTGLPVTLAGLDPDGAVIGGLALIATEYPELADRGRPWLGGVIVAPHRRDGGIGTELIGALTAWAARAGIAHLWVAASGRAVRFYERCGFQVVEHATVAAQQHPVTVLRLPIA